MLKSKILKITTSNFRKRKQSFDSKNVKFLFEPNKKVKERVFLNNLQIIHIYFSKSVYAYICGSYLLSIPGISRIFLFK